MKNGTDTSYHVLYFGCRRIHNKKKDLEKIAKLYFNILLFIQLQWTSITKETHILYYFIFSFFKGVWEK